ncbi:MAG: hypothetical protein MJZ57_04850 [Bacteroidales bacterium]|nr:hypothetical protein [Bacteroidales bacterium]
MKEVKVPYIQNLNPLQMENAVRVLAETDVWLRWKNETNGDPSQFSFVFPFMKKL